jgi:hypothetical protein
MKQYIRFIYHLSSGVAVTRYCDVVGDEPMTKDDIKQLGSLYKNNKENITFVTNDGLGGFFIPDIDSVLAVEIDIVTEKPLDTRS